MRCCTATAFRDCTQRHDSVLSRKLLSTESVEAPGWQGDEEGEYREYLTDERRSQAGCIGARMPTNLWDRTLAPAVLQQPDDLAAASPARERSPRDYASLFARGLCMGAADVVPGVSGGTMAFILGIYEELIDSIRAVGHPDLWRALLGLRFEDAIERLNWRFLVAVGAGIIAAILSLARLLSWLLRNHPIPLWSFFFGLIVASVLVVSRRISRWTPQSLAVLGGGALGAYVLVGLVPAETPNTPIFLFFSGTLAISAMILPGISGSFILVLLGKYQTLLEALNARDVATLGYAMAGMAIGIVTVAQVLGWLFRRHHDVTVALLTGLMLGSLRKVWPWKIDLLARVNRHGETVPVLQENFLPAAWSGEVTGALALAIIGLVLVLLLERSSRSTGAEAAASP